MDWLDLYEWIQTVSPEDLPPAPIALGPQITVTNTAAWLRSLQQDAKLRGKAPRARYGALQDDLRRAYELRTATS
jgi:hypothetical protein